MTKTGVVWDPIYAEHVMSSYHPESPARILSVKEVLDKTEAGRKTIRINARSATKDEIAFIHDNNYIDFIEGTAGRSVSLDPDTTTCPKTWEAACMAAGGCIEAVSAVLSGEVDNAFAFVRPPGHHAEQNRAMGFCFFNNIAIAAEYAIKKHGIKRIAIADFDIHHGNGTQHVFYNRSDVFYISTHRWPFFPGSGNSLERGAGLGNGYTLNIPLMQGSDDEFIDSYREIVFPALKGYKPELILVSAGYDAHERDMMGGFEVKTESYKLITEGLVNLARECCGGKIVFVLEGGYDTDALKECVQDALEILEK